MKYITRYIRFFMVSALCLNSATMLIASEKLQPSWNIPVPSYVPVQSSYNARLFSKQTFENVRSFLSKGFTLPKGLSYESLIAKGKSIDPKIMIAPAAVVSLLLMIHYVQYGDNALCKFCHKKCKEAQDALGKCVDMCIEKLPYIIRAPLKKMISYLCGGATHYAFNNKKIVSGALLLHVVGRGIGHSTPCDVLAGIIATLGYVKSNLDEYDKRNQKGFSDLKDGQQKIQDEVKNQAEITRIQAEKNKKEVIDKIDQDITRLSVQIAEIQEKISAEITASHDDVSNKINGVDVKVTALSTGLGGLKQEIITLAGRFDELHKDNVKKDEMAEGLLQKLSIANESLLSAQQKFDSLVHNLTQQMKDLTETTVAQLTNIQSQTNTQGKDVAAIRTDVDGLMTKATENNQLLTVLQNVQNENNGQLLALHDEIKKLSANDTVKLEFFEKIITAQETSAIQFATNMSNLNEAQKKNEASFSSAFDRMNTMENNIASLATQVSSIEENNQQLLVKIDQNRTASDLQFAELKDKYKKSKKKNRELLEGIQRSQLKQTTDMLQLRSDFAKTSENLRKQNEQIMEQNSETQNLVREASFTSGAVVFPSNHAPNSFPQIESSQIFSRQSSTYNRSFSPKPSKYYILDSNESRS